MSVWRMGTCAVVLGYTCLASSCGDGAPNLGPKGDLSYVQGDAATDHDATLVVPDAPDSSAQDAGTASASAKGLPCDVDALLQASCRSCHGAKPIGGAPMSLLGYDDLAAPSKSDPSQSYAERSLAEMQAGTMPIGMALASSAVAPFAAWLKAGMPRGTCGADVDAGAADPFGTPVMCSSAQQWTFGDRGSSLMHPGGACIDCHTRSGGEGPVFALAGTVYPTAHEPDDCYGSSASGVTIEITDALGTVHTLTPNGSGNFSSKSAIRTPYTAQVRYQGRTRAMATPQRSGDCNGCHTQDGSQDAPGRILLP